MKILWYFFPERFKKQIFIYLVSKAIKKDKDFQLLGKHSFLECTQIVKGSFMFYYNLKNKTTHITKFDSIHYHLFIFKNRKYLN